MKVGLKLLDCLLAIIDSIKARTMPRRVRTPNCTHVDMDRIYGGAQQCFVCGREPSIGFLYECRQDYSSASLYDLLAAPEDGEPQRPKSPLRCELENAGLSESIIRTAEQGQYSSAQLETLKAQKQDLKQIIEDSIQGRQINDVVAKLTAFASTPSNNDGAIHSKVKDAVSTSSLWDLMEGTDESQSAVCAFRACHTCRPYYRDRVYISFDAVVSADFRPVSEDETQYLPTKSAQVLRSIGAPQQASATHVAHDESPSLTQTTITYADHHDAPHTASTVASDSSDLTFKTTQTDVDELRALRRPRRRFYNIGHRSSGEIARDLSRIPPLLSRQRLKTAMQAIFHPGRDSSSSGSMITLPVPRTGTVRDSSATRPVGDFDIGALRRVRRQKERNEIRNGTYVGGFEDVGSPPATTKPNTAQSPYSSDGEGSCTSDSDFSVYSCISEGSEVEVDGGVALSEEAVESDTPDIVAVDIRDDPPSKTAICVRTKPLSWTEEISEDIGVQSIMAQI
ncbi:hypothetical protein E8E12_004474 [Didymella heteroderae]|uniref:Uncharacterized protein n=1 Tax=Didymella heteroderae TaxID=1769908 RepID=A0A9P4WND2_9PLEO|nr:hypothetical protein E8E12_004474 [Didymella heteroderae]